MNQLKIGACLAQGKETCASSSLGFRDERLLKLEQILEQYNELDFKEPDDIRMSGQLVMGLVEEINKKLIRLLESKRRPLGSFWGGSSYKFLIYRYNNKPTDPRVVSDDQY